MNAGAVSDAAAIVLAGGRSSRMGAAKPALDVGGQTLVERVLSACAGAGVIPVVVGTTVVPAGITQLVENPAGAGPVHAIAAAAGDIRAHRCFVLAADLPFLSVAALRALGDVLDGRGDVWVAVDDRGRRQYLLAVWRTEALRKALQNVGATVDASLRSLYADVEVLECSLPGEPPPWWDCDTPDALAAARAWATDAAADHRSSTTAESDNS